MLKAYKYRIYPNNEQKVQIEKTFGVAVLCIIRTLAYTERKIQKKRKNLSAKQIVIITATGN